MEINIDVLHEDDTVFVSYKGVCHFISIKDIRIIKSEGNYSRIFFKNEYVVILKSLNKLENRLDSNVFFRVNRYQIVNIKMIQRMGFENTDGIYLYMDNGEKVVISRRQYVRFKSLKSF